MAAQVAAQTGQTAEGVMKNHEGGKETGGISSHAVGSGEKFSFARLRQAISKKVRIFRNSPRASGHASTYLGRQGRQEQQYK